MSDDKATIMLATEFNIKQVEFPCVCTEKLDGAAADFYAKGTMKKMTVHARTRQDKTILSCQHILDYLLPVMSPKEHIVCELYVPGLSFKEIGGLSRRKQTVPELEAHVYDYYEEGQEHREYYDRMMAFAKNIGQNVMDDDSPVKLIPATRCDTPEELLKFLEEFTLANPNAEGVVIRSLHGEHSTYMIAKRSEGLMRYKPTMTADLVVVGFEQAINAKTKEGKGMVGRVILEYKGRTIGAGAGTMSHKERKEVWDNAEDYIGRFAEVAYKPDPSYSALREARFYRWRPDKD